MLGVPSLLVVVGPPGSGKSLLAEMAAARGAELGLRVLRATPAAGLPDGLVWAQLLQDLGETEAAASILGDPAPLELDRAARLLARQSGTLVVVDDADRAGAVGLQFLAVLASRLGSPGPAVVVTAGGSLGMDQELALGPLSGAELAEVVPGLRPDELEAVRVAAGGMPGPALALARAVAEADPDEDVVVALALRAPSKAGFLDIDPALIGLLETALGRARGDASRARILARLARELLPDATASARRRELVDEALALARTAGDGALLAEVLDARLHALWDPAGAQDRLAAATEIANLARAAGDGARERHGLFWRFVALMELGRVPEAESALAAHRRLAEASGDLEDLTMAVSRQAVLDILRGRFDDAERLVPEVAELARRAGLPDAERLVATIRGGVAAEREPQAFQEAVVWFRSLAARMPGHLMEATAVRVLAVTGHRHEAAADLQRLVPAALRGSGPRWVGAVTDLAAAAAAVGDLESCRRLYPVLLPYRGRLVVWAGAVAVTGPVSYYLGLLATALGDVDEALVHLREALEAAEEVGALPSVAHCLVAYADAVALRGADDDLRLAEDHRRRARALAERLRMATLLQRLAPAGDEWSLRRDGQDWLLDAGEEHARLRDAQGLHHLRALLAAPGQELAALDLAAGGAGLRAAGAGPVLDDAARAAYRARLAALDAAAEAADRSGDADEAERAQAERAAVLAELRRAAGLGGRARQVSPEAERARVNVTRALRSALDRITTVAPRAGTHLQQSVRTGHFCRYQPAASGPDRWRV